MDYGQFILLFEWIKFFWGQFLLPIIQWYPCLCVAPVSLELEAHKMRDFVHSCDKNHSMGTSYSYPWNNSLTIIFFGGAELAVTIHMTPNNRNNCHYRNTTGPSCCWAHQDSSCLSLLLQRFLEKAVGNILKVLPNWILSHQPSCPRITGLT
jgi:hypothetical protein